MVGSTDVERYGNGEPVHLSATLRLHERGKNGKQAHLGRTWYPKVDQWYWKGIGCGIVP